MNKHLENKNSHTLKHLYMRERERSSEGLGGLTHTGTIHKHKKLTGAGVGGGVPPSV